jgi:hypothetical protein
VTLELVRGTVTLVIPDQKGHGVDGIPLTAKDLVDTIA